MEPLSLPCSNSAVDGEEMEIQAITIESYPGTSASEEAEVRNHSSCNFKLLQETVTNISLLLLTLR